MDVMVEISAYLSCGAAACYIWGRKLKRSADHLKSIPRMKDLKYLDELVRKEPTNQLVVVSGRVGSEAPLNCKHNGGLLCVLMEENAELDVEIELGDAGLIKKSLKFLLHQKETPWYLEDSTGHRANVMGAQDALGFDDILKKYAFEMPASELFKSLALPEDFMVLRHHCHGRALSMDNVLTFVGEAVRDKAGNLMIQSPKEHSLVVFSREDSLDTIAQELESASEVYSFLATIIGGIAVAVAVIYGVGLIRRVLSPYVAKISETAKADRTETHQREELDTRRFRPLRAPIGLAYILYC